MMEISLNGWYTTGVQGRSPRFLGKGLFLEILRDWYRKKGFYQVSKNTAEHPTQYLICLPIIHQAVVKQHVHSCPGCAILGQVFKVPEQWMGTRQNITVKVVKQAACNNSNWDFCLHQDWGVPTLPWHMLRHFNLIHSYNFPRKWYDWFLVLLLT